MNHRGSVFQFWHLKLGTETDKRELLILSLPEMDCIEESVYLKFVFQALLNPISEIHMHVLCWNFCWPYSTFFNLFGGRGTTVGTRKEFN